MKRRFILVFLLLAIFCFLAGCDFLNSITQLPDDKEQENLEEQETYKIYRLAASAGYEGTYEEWLKSIKGEKGEAGVGIASIEKTNTVDLVDTYTITFTDGSTSTFTITNGADGQDGAQGAPGEKGDDGVGVVSIEKIKTEGLVDTYLITYTNGNTYEFTITNGQQGDNGVGITSVEKIKTEGLIDTYLITYTNGNTYEFIITNGQQGDNGVGVTSIEKTGTVGLVDTYLITYTDGTTYEYQVNNGQTGAQGENGKSAYQIYIEAHPDYTKSEEDWLDDLVNGRLATVEVVKYNVTFDSDGGSEVAPQEVEQLNTIKRPNNPVKEGYTFEGWYVDDEKWVFSGYLVTSDLELKAKWSVNSYTITFNPNEGRCAINSLIVKYDESYVLPTPTRDGYNFGGWYNGEELFNKEKYDLASNITLVANWKRLFTIHYDTNGATEIDDLNGVDIVESLENPIRSGYSFKGWYYNGQLLNAPFTYNFDESEITIVANWAENSGDYEVINHTISYEECHGIVMSKTGGGNWDWVGLKYDGDLTDYTRMVAEITGPTGAAFSFKINDQVEVHADGTGELIHVEYELSVNFAWSEDRQTMIMFPDIGAPGIGNEFDITKLELQGDGKEPINLLDCKVTVASSFVSADVNQEAKTIEGLAIVGYNGSDEIVAIPSEIDSKKVTMISNDAFNGNAIIKKIVLPDTIESIGDNAFANMLNLEEVVFNKEIKSYGNDLLLGDNKLKKITVSSDPLLISFFDFDEKNIPSGLEISFIKGTKTIAEVMKGIDNTPYSAIFVGEWKSIRSGELYNCKSVTNVIFPEELTEIRQSAFYGCISLTNVIIPENVKVIQTGAFSNCASLTNITIPNGVTSIENGTFSYCTSLVSFNIPNSVTTIGYDAFRGCTNLASITIPDKVAVIGDNAFYECKKLKALVIPDGVSSINSGVFYECLSLAYLVIPNTITSIAGDAISSSNRLMNIFYAGSKAEWFSIKPDNFSKNDIIVFNSDVNKLTLVEEEQYSYYLTNTGQKIGLYCVNKDIEEIEIPDDISSIANNAFEYCSKLKSVTIPNSVTNIGAVAFYECDSLEYIVIPEGVTIIGDWAFGECDSLTSIIIPNTVNSIGSRAFYNCFSLTSLTLSDSVTSIGSNAFYRCRSLAQIYYYGSIEQYSEVDNMPTYGIVYYYYENRPDTGGNYWHYVDGVPTIWD